MPAWLIALEAAQTAGLLVLIVPFAREKIRNLRIRSLERQMSGARPWTEKDEEIARKIRRLVFG